MLVAYSRSGTHHYFHGCVAATHSAVLLCRTTLTVTQWLTRKDSNTGARQQRNNLRLRKDRGEHVHFITEELQGRMRTSNPGGKH